MTAALVASAARRSRLYLLSCLGVAAFAFAFTWATGHRGVFLLDQSIMFDAGWRIFTGQTAYKDFYLQYGPLSFYIQALFFRIFGVHWSSTVIPACLIDSVAALAAIRIVRQLTDSRALALAAGVATAVSCQAPFGTLWIDQTALIFDMLALLAVVEAPDVSRRIGNPLYLLAGISVGLATLSKQNFGGLFLPITLAVAVAGQLPSIKPALRAAFGVVAGFAAIMAVFVGWLWFFSDFPSFVRTSIATASAIGQSRLALPGLLKALSFRVIPIPVQFDLLGFVGGSAALVVLARRRPMTWNLCAPAVIAILLPWFRSLTQQSTLNEWQNNFTFVGLSGCLGIWLLYQVANNAREPVQSPQWLSFIRPGFAAVCALWGIAVFGYEARADWLRVVQEFRPGDRFDHPLQIAGMEGVRWAEPTRIGYDTGIILRQADFEAVVTWLRARHSRFFVMGDAALLYGLAGVSSPQPVLYFAPAPYILDKDIPALDHEVVTSLDRNQVDIVIYEKAMFSNGAHDLFPRFTLLWGWFQGNFSHVRDFGIFEIWERRPGAR